MAIRFFDNVRHAIATTGTGAITLGTVPAGWQSFVDAGAVDGDNPPYRLAEGDAWENGYLTLDDSGTTATRTVTGSSDGGDPIDLGGAAVLTCTVTADLLSDIVSDLAGKAPLASPTFTGTPAAPTATGGTNTTQIATTAFVRGEIASLLDSAPGTLDTLNELAAALGDDANFAATMTTALAGKQAADADLDAIAGLGATAGLLSRTGAGAFAVRTLTAPAAGITVSNGDGASGNPTLALANDLAALEGLGSTGIAARTAANTWAQRSIAGTTNRLTVSNGDGVAGNPTLDISSSYDALWQPIDADLTAFAALDATAGLLAKTGANAYSRRTITGTSNRVDVTNGSGASGNPTIDISNTLLATLADLGANAFTALQTITVANNALGVLVNSPGGGLRLVPSASGGFLDAVDPTGLAGYASLGLGGSEIILFVQGTPRVVLTADGMFSVSGGAFGTGAPVIKTANFSLAATENSIINNKSGSACVVTLPAASSWTGRRVRFKNIQAQQLNSNASNVKPLGTNTAGTSILSANAGRWAEIESDGADWVIMSGVV